MSKTLDTLRSLTGDEKLSQHARINDRPVDEALMQWKWDRGRWGDGGKVGDVVEALTKVRHLGHSLDHADQVGDELDRFGTKAKDAVVQSGQG